jgi:hypothetical protein
MSLEKVGEVLQRTREVRVEVVRVERRSSSSYRLFNPSLERKSRLSSSE